MRAAIIPYVELVETHLKPQLRPYMGFASELIPLAPLIEGMLDTYFNAVPWLSPMSPRTVMVRDFRVPPDRAREICDLLVWEVGQMVQQAFVVVYPGRTYRHTVIENESIRVEEYSADEQLSPYEQDPSTIDEDDDAQH